MNPVAEEMLTYLGTAKKDDNSLEHYGMPRRSGRYPWGSGDNPYQHGRDFLSRIEELKKSGWKENAANVKKEFGLTLDEYRREKSWANYERKMPLIEQAKRLKSEGKGASEIGRIMGVNESTVRSYLNPQSEARLKEAANTADFLRKQVDEKGMIDVGRYVEKELGISRDRLDTAIHKLRTEGYELYGGGIKQPTNPGQQTNQLVLCKPGTQKKDIYDFEKVHTITDYASADDGKTFKKFQYPASMDSKRLMIRYAEDGGIERDGIVELRRGVPDLSLGDAMYSQVRILVDGKKYIKGMAVYSDDMPDGVDVIFNTNKKKNVPKLEVLKDIKNNPDNPFGANIGPKGQSTYIDKDGKEKLSLINKKSTQGDWSDWSDALPSQFLSKQSTALAKQQLGLAKKNKQEEFDEIMSLTNPTVKKYFLQKFADGCDSAAVDLKAAALPGQKYHVLIPINSLKDTEVYAPQYENGTKLALIRYPHGGTFEIPILTVNNRNQDGKRLITPLSQDAVGINHKVAERLSGADFDGDTAMCIPTHNGKVKITSTPPLKGLEGFDPKMAYPEVPGMKYMKDPVTKTDNTQKQMGVISNLITDMTLAGASNDELARAVRHSMVVIDAGKHKLNYKQSEIDNNIAELKKKYQGYVDDNGRERAGAGTIISRAKSQYSVDKRQGSYKINSKDKPWYDPSKPDGAKIWNKADDLYTAVYNMDKATNEMVVTTVEGKKVRYRMDDKEAVDFYRPVKRVDPKTGDVTFTNKDGSIQYRTKTRTQKSTRMAETDDAYSLVSEARHPMELIYADYANSMKAMGNKARLELLKTGKIPHSATAKSKYQAEYDSLMSKLNNAQKNAVREREVLRRSNVDIKSKQLLDPDMSKSDLKKINQDAVSKYRAEIGSVSRRERNIKISDREWEAIQAGAISENKLKQILDNADPDDLRQRSMPKTTIELSTTKVDRLKDMAAKGYTLQEIANKLDISTSTVNKYLKG